VGRVAVTCDFCGRTAPGGSDDALPLTWSTSVERGRVHRYCDVCSREHVRSMEGKLDVDFW
jgi:ribosomal protein S27E